MSERGQGMKTILKFSQKKLFLSISILILGVFAFLLFLFLNQTYSFYIPCFFHKITGLYCPGCGITRMVLSLLHLDFYQAFRWNPFLFLLTPLFIVYGVAYFLYWLYDREAPKLPNTIWNILLIAAIVFMALRNIPFFDYLKPTFIK